MASNDPTDTGGLFIGRRPGTAPVRFRTAEAEGGPRRRGRDRLLAGVLLAIETLLCLSLFGPQPAGWLASLFLTMALAKRVDHAWKLVRRAAGYHQERGALERIFAMSVGIAVVVFFFWFLVIEGPGPNLAPRN
jgi:hypothetical protein